MCVGERWGGLYIREHCKLMQGDVTPTEKESDVYIYKCAKTPLHLKKKNATKMRYNSLQRKISIPPLADKHLISCTKKML